MIHEIIRKRRRELEITQKELADKANLTATTINTFENGKGNICSKSLEKIFDILNLKIV